MGAEDVDTGLGDGDYQCRTECYSIRDLSDRFGLILVNGFRESKENS